MHFSSVTVAIFLASASLAVAAPHVRRMNNADIEAAHNLAMDVFNGLKANSDVEMAEAPNVRTESDLSPLDLNASPPLSPLDLNKSPPPSPPIFPDRAPRTSENDREMIESSDIKPEREDDGQAHRMGDPEVRETEQDDGYDSAGTEPYTDEELENNDNDADNDLSDESDHDGVKAVIRRTPQRVPPPAVPPPTAPPGDLELAEHIQHEQNMRKTRARTARDQDEQKSLREAQVVASTRPVKVKTRTPDSRRQRTIYDPSKQ